MICLLLLAVSVLPSLAQSAPPAARPANAAAQQLHRLFQDDWDYYMQENPVWASMLGDRRWNDRWEERTLERERRIDARLAQSRKRLQRIPRAQLSRADQLNYDLYEFELADSIEGRRYRGYLLPVNHMEGLQNDYDIADRLRFQTVKDYEDWIARLNAYDQRVEQTVALLREGIRAGIVHPKVVLQRVPAQLDKLLVEPEKSAFYAPFTRFPRGIPEAEQKRLAEAGRGAVAGKVLPSLRRYREFFIAEYLPKGYDQVGAWQHPDAPQFYAYRARSYTTTPMTPEEIHEIGLAEVKRIRGEMEAIKAKVGFQGTLAEFFTHLRTDPKFFYRTGDELLQASRALAKRIDPELVTVFRTMPRMPYGVKPIPDAIAPDTTTAYYNGPAADGSRAGYYFVNLYKPEVRPRWEMLALTLHEAVPGHHFQIALAQEAGELPNFRKYGGYTAFNEGWGLYAESLGEDMNLYGDPYDKFGQLTYEMWRAVRLVVDTGMHHKRWSRQQAIDFFMENAAKTEQDIVNEIDRYIAWPGQALAYKIGELRLKALRRRAREQLGPRFDLKEFHDVVLLSGALPLNVLERRVEEWIARAKAEPKNGAARKGGRAD
jgi:uncharacterized protein (DUF885 family)